MQKGKILCFCLFCVLLSGCAGNLKEYEGGIKLRVYGNETLEQPVIEAAEAVAEQYADCLFTIGNGTVDEETLKKLAPNESAEEWETIYRKNQTKAELKNFQMADIYIENAREIQCLTLCEARYSDWSTPENDYLFVVEMDMKKENDVWYIQESDMLSASRKSESRVMRDDFTGAIKIVTREEAK